MLYEAELFIESERVLVEVLGRIRPEDRDTVLPPVRTGDPPRSLAETVEQAVRDDELLAAGLGRAFRAAGLDDASGQACAAAATARDSTAHEDGERSGDDPGGDRGRTVRERLLQAAVARSLLAHHVATTALGSTACPLPEELARPLWELTRPDAAAWRALGWFRAPLPLPPHVSWRDRFLRTAGHDPHPPH